jgi:hypothetical protein
LSDVTTIAKFLIADLQETCHIQYTGIFVIYRRNKFQMPKSNASLVITINTKGEENICNVVLLFYIHKIITLTKAS